MSDTQREQEHHEPNEFGFAGAATAPEPERTEGEDFGERVAVPSGDLTGAITDAIDEATERHDKDEDEDEES